MSVNLAEQTLEDRLVNKIAELEQDIRDIKTKQRIGGDNTIVGSTNVTNIVIPSVPANSNQYVIFQISPVGGRLTLWNMFFSVYVDGMGFADTNRFPDGSSLSGGQLKMKVRFWGDWGLSSDSTGLRWYWICVENYDTAAHTIGIRGSSYAILTSAAGSTS